MKLTPLYDVPHYLDFVDFDDDPSVPVARQRRRLAATLTELSDDEWSAPSRCDAWSVQDVVSHLSVTNRFWAASVEAGRRGEPSRLLSDFDPVASPAELAAADRATPTAKVLERFVETNEALLASLEGLDPAEWTILAEAPPGHIPIRGLAYHALWDSWIHERDILVPLGREQVIEPDEIVASLEYAAVLSPAFAVAYGSTRAGTILVEVTEPDARFLVEVGSGVRVRERDLPDEAPAGALVLRGRAVELLEGISYRVPLTQTIGAEHEWLFSGLAKVFDRES